MLFNSLQFAVFIPIVFSIYWLANCYSVKVRNLFLLIASYVFYGWWDWRFLSLIFISSVIDFFIGSRLEVEKRDVVRKYMLLLSICTNLGILFFFKYFIYFLF